MGGINKEVDMTILERTNPVFNTAKMTLYQLSAVGDPDAAAIAKELDLTMEETQNSKTTTAGSEQILAGEITMDIRFNIMSRLADLMQPAERKHASCDSQMSMDGEVRKKKENMFNEWNRF